MKTIGVVVVALTTQKQTGKDKPMKTPYQEAVELIDRHPRTGISTGLAKGDCGLSDSAMVRSYLKAPAHDNTAAARPLRPGSAADVQRRRAPVGG
jgi:hypothetical protein